MYMVHLPSGYYGSFVFIEGVRDARRAAAYMCQFTRSEYKRPTGILSKCTSLRPLLLLGWPKLHCVQDSLKYKGPLPLSCSCCREHTPLIGLADDSSFLTTSFYWVSVPVSGLPVSTMIFWKGVSFHLGMAINLISLLWTILHSSHRRWLLHRLHLRSTYEAWKAGTLTKACIGGHRSFSFYCGLFFCSIQLFFGLSISFVSVLALEGVTAFVFCCLSRRPFYCHYFLDSDGQFIAHAFTLSLSYEKAPGPSATGGEMFHPR